MVLAIEGYLLRLCIVAQALVERQEQLWISSYVQLSHTCCTGCMFAYKECGERYATSKKQRDKYHYWNDDAPVAPACIHWKRHVHTSRMRSSSFVKRLLWRTFLFFDLLYRWWQCCGVV